jgi:hypothetical protein
MGTQLRYPERAGEEMSDKTNTLATTSQRDEAQPRQIYDWGGKQSGAGRPLLYGYKQQSITFSCPRELVAQIEAQALKEGISRSRAIVALIEKGVGGG